MVVGDRERGELSSVMCCVLAAKCEESGCGRFFSVLGWIGLLWTFFLFLSSTTLK